MVSQLTSAPPDLMTAEEFYDWAHLPENADGSHELEDGKIVQIMSRPNRTHGLICWIVSHWLGNYVIPRGGYLLTNDTGFIVKRRPDSVRGPDVMMFLKADFRILDDIQPKYVENVPDLIVEVYSPTDRPGKLNKRIKEYLGKGVPLIWVIYPQDRTVAVFRLKSEFESLDEIDTLEGKNAPPDYKLPVADLFRQPGTPTQE